MTDEILKVENVVRHIENPFKRSVRSDPEVTVQDFPHVPTPYRRRYSLKTLRGIRSEMAATYREMRSGMLESSEGTRYVYVLVQIAKVLEVAELERRLALLEAKSVKS